ncbi:MAG: glutamyl-tRNA reductase [Flavobacteriales bacterium]
MNELRVIAITHKNFSLEEIGHFHIAQDNRFEILQRVKDEMAMPELMYLSTCNRVEIIFSKEHYICPGQTALILESMFPSLESALIKSVSHKAERYNGVESIEHLLRVASSLESLVIGEREIITQLRKSYEECAAQQLTGDQLRMVINQCVKTAKEVFTYTDLSKKPVSVVSLAWKKFVEAGIKTTDRVLLIGAGQIIRNFSKFLFENEYHNVVIANRTKANAEALANATSGIGISLNELEAYDQGFDALVTCTGAEDVIVSKELFNKISGEKEGSQLIIDLAIPQDIAHEVATLESVQYVDMVTIQKIASENIQYREQAISECAPIIHSGIKECERAFNERRVEQAMRSIPDMIREIKSSALGNVFAKDLEKLDDSSKEILEKILLYMEKKYISVPMKMAREVLLDEVKKN